MHFKTCMWNSRGIPRWPNTQRKDQRTEYQPQTLTEQHVRALRTRCWCYPQRPKISVKSVSGWPCPGWGWSRQRPESCQPQPGCEHRGQEVSHHVQRDKTSSIRWRTPQTPTTAPSQGYRTWSGTRVLILHQLIILPSKRGRDLGLHGFCGSYKPLVSEAESTPKTQQFREE